MPNKKMTASFLSKSAVIAALYGVLTYLSYIFGLSSGFIQVRFSEMITVLPMFTPAAIPGLFIGCLVSNILCGGNIWDIVFGSLATLIGAYGTYVFREKDVKIALLSPVFSNTLIIPFILKFTYGVEGAIPVFMIAIAMGEMISAWLFGIGVYRTIKKYKIKI